MIQQLLDAHVHAVSAKVTASLVAVGFIISDATNPIVAIGGAILVVGGVITLGAKAWAWLATKAVNEKRQARMLSQFEGNDEHPGVMDEIKSLHAGQQEILDEIAKLTR